jgi:N-acyl-D-aspartate/D-glutamate deacylase
MVYDIVIRDGLTFDGTGKVPPRILNVVDAHDRGPVGDARLPGRAHALRRRAAAGAGLPESVRHGVTTVCIGSCSLSTIYATPEDCADIFTRVEALPREYVLPRSRAQDLERRRRAT